MKFDSDNTTARGKRFSSFIFVKFGKKWPGLPMEMIDVLQR